MEMRICDFYGANVLRQQITGNWENVADIVCPIPGLRAPRYSHKVSTTTLTGGCAALL
jgi:hypothetical protein